MFIPNFMNSEHAISFGEKMDYTQAVVVRKLQLKHASNADSLRKTGNLDAGMIAATQSQFCREALEAFQKRFKDVS